VQTIYNPNMFIAVTTSKVKSALASCQVHLPNTFHRKHPDYQQSSTSLPSMLIHYTSLDNPSTAALIITQQSITSNTTLVYSMLIQDSRHTKPLFALSLSSLSPSLRSLPLFALSLSPSLSHHLLRLLTILANQKILPVRRPHNLPTALLTRLIGHRVHDVAGGVCFAGVVLQDGDACGGEIEAWMVVGCRGWGGGVRCGGVGSV
jgi:hypothetical protein